MAKRLNSRQKGARGELFVAKLLTRIGYPATRAARLGVDGGEDIVCESLRGKVHIEVKFTETIGLGTKELYDAIRQSEDAAPGKAIPVVIWKNNRAKPCMTWWEYSVGPVTVCGEASIKCWLASRVGEEARAGQ